MKTQKPPMLGTAVRISLTLPTGSTVELSGQIESHIPPGGLEGRGPGIDISIHKVPQSVLWLIESALTSAGLPPPSVQTSAVSSAEPQVAREARVEFRETGSGQSSESAAMSPALEDGDEWVQAEGELVKALWQELSGMSKMNAFQLLDVPYSAGDTEVRNGFQELSKKYHPDRFTRYESFEIRELANEVFILLRDAYRALADEGGRQSLLRALPSATTGHQAPRTLALPLPAPPLPPSPPLAAVASKSQPRPLVSEPVTKSDSAAAPGPSRLLEEAPPVSAASNNYGHVDYALGFLESGQYEQALRILRVEARKDPTNTRALAGVELAAGRLALADGDRLEAAERFEAALVIDPLSERAAREIADMRRHATSQRRGLLSKLMKKV